MPERQLLEAITNSEHWTEWGRHFGPPSRLSSQIKEATRRYVFATFAYGCGLGPTEAARHLNGTVTADQLAFVDRRHVDIADLRATSADLINLYLQFELVGHWGSGEAAVADGTHFEIYEDNLLAEHHIRYGKTAHPPARSPRISPPDVFQAADALLIEGHKPTIDRVRMRIGRGSPNTIQEHLEVRWTHLGSRLRDIPGREFPELPDRVALARQQLWNEALDAAHETLGEKVTTRERFLVEREEALTVREQQFLEQEQAAIARAAAQEESLALARGQLLAANQQTDRLEVSLQARETETERQRIRTGLLESDAAQLRDKLEVAAAAHQAERTKLDEHQAATEARWLVELDRARQAGKEAAREQERQSKEWRAQVMQLQAEREELKKHLQEARSEVRTLMSERAQLEKRLASATATKGHDKRVTPAKSGNRRAVRSGTGGTADEYASDRSAGGIRHHCSHCSRLLRYQSRSGLGHRANGATRFARSLERCRGKMTDKGDFSPCAVLFQRSLRRYEQFLHGSCRRAVKDLGSRVEQRRPKFGDASRQLGRNSIEMLIRESQPPHGR
jgi:hypothetical protein